MASVLVETAFELTDVLNRVPFSQYVAAERSYANWDEELKSMGELHVDVVQISQRLQGLDRCLRRIDCELDIGVRKRFESSEDDETGRIIASQIDPIADLQQEIADYVWCLRAIRTPTYGEVGIIEPPETRSWYVRKHLREWRQYTGIIRHKFAVVVE